VHVILYSPHHIVAGDDHWVQLWLLLTYNDRRVLTMPGLIPPAMYYSRVALEMGKIIFEQRKMGPPYVLL
jgi:hypothetical protein